MSLEDLEKVFSRTKTHIQVCTHTDTSINYFIFSLFAVCSVKGGECRDCSVQTGKWQLYLGCVKCARLLPVCASVAL